MVKGSHRKIASPRAKTASSQRSEKSQSATALRITDPETTRVVAIHRPDGTIVGAGCLVDGRYVLTCKHVVAAALPEGRVKRGEKLYVTLVGIAEQPTVGAKVLKVESGAGPKNDLALLRLGDLKLELTPAEFASPLRHSGKAYSVLGFPAGDRQGRNATGRLHAADALGLVQMDRGGSLFVLGGFSGAPVWCSDVNAFVGLVVTELSNHGVSWCIPSRRLCEFFPDLIVRFRMPPADRPVVHDYREDDPNLELFGTSSEHQGRKLSAKFKKKGKKYKVFLTVEALPRARKLRGGFVTFITYPDFKQEHEDAYELFGKVEGRKAETDLKLWDSFTVAAVTDGGDVALTLNLELELERHKQEREQLEKEVERLKRPRASKRTKR